MFLYIFKEHVRHHCLTRKRIDLNCGESKAGIITRSWGVLTLFYAGDILLLGRTNRVCSRFVPVYRLFTICSTKLGLFTICSTNLGSFMFCSSKLGLFTFCSRFVLTLPKKTGGSHRYVYAPKPYRPKITRVNNQAIKLQKATKPWYKKAPFVFFYKEGYIKFYKNNKVYNHKEYIKKWNDAESPKKGSSNGRRRGWELRQSLVYY